MIKIQELMAIKHFLAKSQLCVAALLGSVMWRFASLKPIDLLMELIV